MFVRKQNKCFVGPKDFVMFVVQVVVLRPAPVPPGPASPGGPLGGGGRPLVRFFGKEDNGNRSGLFFLNKRDSFHRS